MFPQSENKNATLQTRAKRSRGLAMTVWTTGLITSALLVGPSSVQAADILKKGDAAVTMFSGAGAPGPDTSGHPFDTTFIDERAPSLKILDLSNIGPRGAQTAAPVTHKISARDIGQVFGLAIVQRDPERAPDIYAAATSFFGLAIVANGKDGKPVRLVRGAPGARWMPGQFGLDRGGGPGAIWRIDGSTGEVSLFSTITSGEDENSGASLGGITFDPVSRQFFVTNLETGNIHRLDLFGRELSVYDHGLTGRAKAGQPQVAYDPEIRVSIQSSAFDTERPETWGYANAKRRAVAVAIHANRLFYSVADGPAVWSIGILADGNLADDPRLEVDVAGTPDAGMITGLDFDGTGAMVLSHRGQVTGSYDYSSFARPDLSQVLRFTWDTAAKTWRGRNDEFAVGRTAPHRAANGGVAFSYGYDDAGKLDMGRCRETLWSTGERLDANQRVRYGLQSSTSDMIQQASLASSRSGSVALDARGAAQESGLEPPTAGRVIDVGSEAETTPGNGPVGAIAIYAPCEGKSAVMEAGSADARMPLPSMPPTLPPGVIISKSCAPAPLGGPVTCTITTTNTGFTLTGPAGFSDVSRIIGGPDAGATVPILSVMPDGPQWLCSPVPTTSLSCTLPAAGLLPGQSRKVDVVIDTGPLVAAGNTGFRNCASLELPWNGKACAESKTQIIVKKTAPASCLPGNDCTFQIAVTNAGAAPFAGGVLLSDSMFIDGGGAAVAAPISSIVPALGCGPDPVALPFSCTANLALAAGQSKVFSLTVKMPGAPVNYWARNCASVSASGQAPPLLPPPAADPSPATSCAWVPVGAPLPLVNLAMKKSALECHKQGLDKVRCHYDIGIVNDGPSPAANLITFEESLPPASVLASIGAPWSCVGGPPTYTCSTAAVVPIAAGATLAIPVAIDLDRAPLEVAKCFAPNKVAIQTPVAGTAQNFNGADDTGAATADAAWIRFDEGGPLELVLCDPTNLATKKVANGDCVESGESLKCAYKITVTNMGPDPFKGKIDVEDIFSVAPTNVEFGPGWICGGAGTKRTCSHAPLELAKGANIDLAVTAVLPKGAHCAIENRATMIFPLAGTRWNLSGADDSAAAVSKVSSPSCSEPPRCEPRGKGEMRASSGACVCTSGYVRGKDGLCTKTGDAGEEPTSPRCKPGPNEYRTSAGECVCKTGYVRHAGVCTTADKDPEPERCTPGPGEIRSSNGRCVCRDGFERDGNGRCVKTPAPKCPTGTHREDDGTCKPDQYETGCEDGAHMDRKTGKCVPDTPRPDPAKDCKAKGWIWTGARCIEKRPETKPDPKPETQPEPKTCPKGTVGTPPNCKRIEPPKCPPGTIGIPPVCKTIELPKCPAGMVGTPPNCKRVAAPTCPPGTRGTPPKCVPLTVAPQAPKTREPAAPGPRAP